MSTSGNFNLLWLRKANIHVEFDLPLRICTEKGHFDIVKYLVEYGAIIRADAIRYSARNGHLEIYEYLVEQNARKNSAHR